MSNADDARYLFRRAREEAAKASDAFSRHASAAEIAAHRELALRYKVRALAASCPDQVLYDAMGNYEIAGETGAHGRAH